jgi:lipopolysaccharide transport system permease protein
MVSRLSGERLVVYTPESALRTPGRLFRSMQDDLFSSKELAWRLLIRNLKAEYRQSVLGYVWAILPPLVNALLWVYLQRRGVVSFQAGASGPESYALYVLTGMLLWQIFVDALSAPVRAVSTSQGMLAKIDFPREALVLAGIGELLVNVAIRLVIVFLAVLWLDASLAPTAWMAPLGLIALIMLGLSIGMLLVPLSVLYQDVTRGIGLITQLWLYATPVVYPVAAGSVLNWANPVSSVLVTTRSWFIGGTLQLMSTGLLVSIASVAFLLLGWILYRVSMPFVIERMPG